MVVQCAPTLVGISYATVSALPTLIISFGSPVLAGRQNTHKKAAFFVLVFSPLQSASTSAYSTMMLASPSFYVRAIFFFVFAGTAMSAYTTYVQDYHDSTQTLFPFRADVQGRGGSSDFPSHPHAQETLAQALESIDPWHADAPTSSM